MDAWVCKKYVQTRDETPHVVEERTFKTEKEAFAFYERNKRAGNWPWTFWGYPDHVLVKGCESAMQVFREESLRKFKQENGIR